MDSDFFLKEKTNDHIVNLILDNDEVNWKSLIFGLIQSEQMDPWDIDISLIANKFLTTLKKLTQLDFLISGKVVLASALLLKLKSDKLMDEEIVMLDQLISTAEEPIELDLIEEPIIEENIYAPLISEQKPELIPKTPQPRKRKVSVYDLVEALESVLETKTPTLKKRKPMFKELKLPENKVDISEIIKEVYQKINTYYTNGHTKKLTFNDIIPSEQKEDKVMTFVPLLHLGTQRKIDIEQKESFEEIFIELLEPNADLRDLNTGTEAAKN